MIDIRYKFSMALAFGVVRLAGPISRLYRIVPRYVDLTHLSWDVDGSLYKPVVYANLKRSSGPVSDLLENFEDNITHTTKKVRVLRSKKDLEKEISSIIKFIPEVSIWGKDINHIAYAIQDRIVENEIDSDMEVFRIKPRTYLFVPRGINVGVNTSNGKIIGFDISQNIDTEKCFIFKIEKRKDKPMNLRDILSDIAKERWQEPSLMRDLRKTYNNFKHETLSLKQRPFEPSIYTILSIGFFEKNWTDFAKHYSGKTSSLYIKLLMSRLVRAVKSQEFEYGLDELLAEFESKKDEENPEFNVKIQEKKIVMTVDYYLLNKIVFAKNAGLNLDQICNIIDRHTLRGTEPESSKNLSTFRKSHFDETLSLLSFIGQEKSYQVIKTTEPVDVTLLYDCGRMFKNLEEKAVAGKYDLSRIKKLPASSMHRLHDELVAEQTYLEKKLDSMDIEYPSYIKKLEKINIDGMVAVLPKTTGELIDIGQRLHNCIGTYKNRVACGQDTIVAFMDTDKKEYKMAMNVHLSYNQQLQRFEPKIIEFREDYNKMVQDDTRKLVEDQLVKIYSKNYKDSVVSKS